MGTQVKEPFTWHECSEANALGRDGCVAAVSRGCDIYDSLWYLWFMKLSVLVFFLLKKQLFAMMTFFITLSTDICCELRCHFNNHIILRKGKLHISSLLLKKMCFLYGPNECANADSHCNHGLCLAVGHGQGSNADRKLTLVYKIWITK